MIILDVRAVAPGPVAALMDMLVAAGHQCYVVGGAVRAIILGDSPADWDVATSATPSDMRLLFKEHRLIDKGEAHGTIGVEVQGVAVEFTTFRVEAGYSDGRRPDAVQFSGDIREDLARRDFTVNAIALRWPDSRVVDPFGGVRDLRRGVIRCVGFPSERFNEDALRMMRAVRFESEYGWAIERRTKAGIRDNAPRLCLISSERQRDEMTRLLVGRFAARALRDLIHLGLMQYIIPEFMPSVGFLTGAPGGTLDEHAVRVVAAVAPSIHLRLAALLHDIAKPCCFHIGEDGQGHFYGHAAAGAEMASSILLRLKYPRDVRSRVASLVREHMFFYSPEVTDAALRRLIGRVGEDNVFDLLELRRADAIAMGARQMPFLAQMQARLQYIIEGGQAVRGSALAVDGNDVMEALGIGPGPEVGRVLQGLLDAVMDDPSLNDKDKLIALAVKIRAAGGPR